MFVIPVHVPVIITMSHEKINTTNVRIAVATSESVFLIPHFARIAVIPAKNEEPAAYSIHILCHLLLFYYSTIKISCIINCCFSDNTGYFLFCYIFFLSSIKNVSVFYFFVIRSLIPCILSSSAALCLAQS